MATLWKSEFPDPLDFNDFSIVTLVELRMRRYAGTIRVKPRWWEKIHDPEIASNWRDEIVEHDHDWVEELWGGEERYEDGGGEKQWPRDPISGAQMQYIFDELCWEANNRDASTGIMATSIPNVFESPSLISSDLKRDLISAASTYENVPDSDKDWHPGSKKQVLDLVHPSLHCVCIGTTLVRSEDAPSHDPSLEVLTNELYTARRPDLSDVHKTYVSTKYQWLPTDFFVSDTGEVATKAYINNVHPIHHRALYRPVSDILSRFVPLFERVLTSARAPTRALAIPVDPYDWYEGLGAEEPEEESDEDDDAFEERHETWEREHRWPVIPDPAPFQPPPTHAPYSLRGRTLQVIVKLANIVLTPNKPKYRGGSWHVEGMANERIIATGLYYYACENITESKLNFRVAIGGGDYGMGLPYQHGDSRGYHVAYGLSGEDEAMVQELGHVLAEEDKCVAFPNFYQHCVAPFELDDPARPGYRKILCFFLVDPGVRILSTTDVPPQQAEWALDEAAKSPLMQKLPQELFDMIKGYVGGMSRADAEAHRKALMEERANFKIELDENVFDMKFSLCEH